MEEGRNNTIPAWVEPRPEPLPTGKYDFLVGELVNHLCWGDHRTVYAAAEYMGEEGWHIVPGTLMPLLR
jgi:hypothetical protein